MLDWEKNYRILRHRKSVTEFPILDMREAKLSMNKLRSPGRL